MGAKGGNFSISSFNNYPRNFISPKPTIIQKVVLWKGNEINNTTQPLSSSHKHNISKQQQPAACLASYSSGSPKTPADQGAGFFQTLLGLLNHRL